MPKTLVQQSFDAFEANVPKNERADYGRAFTAGLTLMNDENTHSHMQLIQNPNARNDIPGTVSKGIAGLVYILYNKSAKDGGDPTMRPEIGVLAGLGLMFKALDMAERGLKVQITPDILADTTEQTSEEVLKKFGITPEMMQEAIAQAGQTQESNGQMMGAQNGNP